MKIEIEKECFVQVLLDRFSLSSYIARGIYEQVKKI